MNSLIINLLSIQKLQRPNGKGMIPLPLNLFPIPLNP